MPDGVWLVPLVCIGVVSVVGVVLTVYDKIAAKVVQRHRVPEAALMTFGILGGALPMYIVMQIIRHKTRKPKFCVGFPIIIVLQAALVIWLLYAAGG